MNLEGASDHEIYELLKLQDAEAWRLAWEKAVLPEARSLRSGQMARRFGITAEEMKRQQQRLENQYEHFEPLLRAMSDVLARTDYHRMDSLSLLMQEAIENGNPDEAERLLREKGSVDTVTERTPIFIK